MILLSSVIASLIAADECHVVLAKDADGITYHVGERAVRSEAEAVKLVVRWTSDDHTGNVATISTTDADCTSPCVDLAADLMALDKPVYSSVYLDRNGKRTDLSDEPPLRLIERRFGKEAADRLRTSPGK